MPARPREMTPSPSLIAALRHLLNPLVRLLVARGFTYPMLADLLKQIYVDTADRDFRLDGEPPTDSRVSLLSGVHRKDVRRLRGAALPEEEAVPEAVALGAQLASAWTTQPEFLDAKGRPRRLARLASKGGRHSFEGLVAGVSRDIRARSVLDEWLRLGVVELDKDDQVVLRAGAFVPARGFEEKAFYFGHNLHDHLAAAAHNLLQEGPPFLERSVHYDAIGQASEAEIAALAEAAGMKALQAINRKAMSCEARDRDEPAPKRRFTFGIYFFGAAADTAPADPGRKP
jgi:uncharacterized protein DUF6502